MDIAKKLYQELTPKQRAVAVYAAINRADGTEGARLLGQAPSTGGHGKAILGLGQARNVYNLLTARSVREILLSVSKAALAVSYCEKWLDADGALDDAVYLKHFKEMEALTENEEAMRGELAAIQQTAREWCDKNGIPVETFSGPLFFMPLTEKKDSDAPVDDEVLAAMRSLFDEIKLAW